MYSYTKDQEIVKSYVAAPGKINTKSVGYICSCKQGSPRPNYVILVSSLHNKDCRVRKALAEMRYSEGDILNYD